MKSKVSIGIIFLFAVVLFSACKEKDKQPEDLGFFSLGEAKDYLLFKPGTWWVYKNTRTNELDTIALTYCKLDTSFAESDKRFFSYENIAFQTQSLRDDALYFTYGLGMSAEALNFSPGWVLECNRIGGFYNNYYSGSGRTCQFFYPFKINGAVTDGVYHTNFAERQDSLSVKSMTYYNIIQFKVTSDNAIPYPNQYILKLGTSQYYWAKHIGLIKIEHQSWDAPNGDNKIYMNWELVEVHIIK